MPPPTRPDDPLFLQPLRWNAEALWERLEPLLPGLTVEVVARCDSTNTRLLDRARASSGRPDARVSRPAELDALAPDAALHDDFTPHGRRQGDIQPSLLVAEQQTRGRGRLGRGWEASAGASLTFSLSLPLAPADWSGLSLAVGLALALALDAAPPAGRPPRIQLKWPNDLWLVPAGGGMDRPGSAAGGGIAAAGAADGSGPAGRKLGGILIETVSVGHHRMCIVGVGLNIAPQAFDGLAHGYACLQEIDPAATAPGVLAQVAEPLVHALLRFEADGFAPLEQAYAQRDLLRGRCVQTTLAELPRGVAEGVDARGALRVRCGTVHHVVSGEVSVRIEAEQAEQAVQTVQTVHAVQADEPPGAPDAAVQ